MAILLTYLQAGTKTNARKLLKRGEVWVDGAVEKRPETQVVPGQVVQIERLAQPKARAPFTILFEDEHLIACVKPAGMLTVNEDSNRSMSLHKLVDAYVREASWHKLRAHVVHRLDRDVSGVLIFAKSRAILVALEDNWRSYEKIYHALVESCPREDEGRVESWLKENKAMKVFSCPEQEGAKHAVTHYRILKRLKDRTLLEIRLETGRKNQIRVHMSDIGCPIVGDAKYGASQKLNRIELYAHQLSITHPVTQERLVLVAPGGLLAR